MQHSPQHQAVWEAAQAASLDHCIKMAGVAAEAGIDRQVLHGFVKTGQASEGTISKLEPVLRRLNLLEPDICFLVADQMVALAATLRDRRLSIDKRSSVAFGAFETAKTLLRRERVG